MAALAALSLPAEAQVDGEQHTPGTSCPTGAVAGQANSPDWDTFFECNGSSQWQRGPYFFGATSDTCDSNHAGLVQYTGGNIEVCNGSAWTSIAQVQGSTPPTAPSGSGYFVMSKSTWTGNLGGLSGANALCLTELTTNTGWAGYATANANGYLTSSNVFAFLCFDLTSYQSCVENLMPLATYYYADANNSSNGGGSFTTDSNGDGPNDNIAWNAANRFGANYQYWIGDRSQDPTNYTTEWYTNQAGFPYDACNGWTDSTSSYDGEIGSAAGTVYTRYSAGGVTSLCNTAQHLICVVNP
ncbi:MAG: hypothetical protein ACLPKW_26700 [Acetobacteraceae bacterium]